jgi:hypothetical protein
MIIIQNPLSLDAFIASIIVVSNESEAELLIN